MTQAPIEPRHKDMAAKAAGYEQPKLVIRSIENGHSPISNETAASILAHAQTLANLEAARTDLAEIHAKLVAARADGLSGSVGAVAGLYAAIDLAAPYRASDPVAEALKAAWQTCWPKSPLAEKHCGMLQAELESRGLEIVERRDR